MASAVRAVPPPTKPFPDLPHKARKWFRVHPFDSATGNYPPAAFNDSGKGDARFSPLRDPDTGTPIPTIYAAGDERGAIAEIVLHDVPKPSTDYLHDLQRDYDKHLHLSRIHVPHVRLVNLTTVGLKAAGLKLSDLFDGESDEYPQTREWALWIWKNMPDAQGLHWMSKRDNRCEVIMLFGDRIDPSKVLDDGDSRPLQDHEDLVVELLAEMKAGIFVSP